MARGRQEPQHDGFVGLDQPYDCTACVAAHAERFEFPVMPTDAAEAWAIFQAMQGQVRVGMEIVGLDYGVLPMLFDLYGVPVTERRFRFEQIAILDHAQSEHRQIERQRESSRSAEAKTQAAAVARG